MIFKYINSKTTIKDNIRVLKTAKGIMTDSKEICEAFSEWFQSDFHKNEDDNIPIIPTCAPSIQPIIFDPIDIEKRLSVLNVSKSIGPDLIHPYVLRECSISLSFPICMIFQKSMDSGTVPSDWKLANITPIFKSDRIISTQIVDHLIKYSIISVRQHGFYPKRNTVTNLIEYLDTLTTALNNNHSVDTIYLDFEKAFDRVPHKRLVKKLESIGICGSLLLWSKSFLSNRKQRVVMGDHVSLWKVIGSGVPQGSVLGSSVFHYLYKGSRLPRNMRGFHCHLLRGAYGGAWSVFHRIRRSIKEKASYFSLNKSLSSAVSDRLYLAYISLYIAYIQPI